MRIAFVGKGGAGKTTLATFFVAYLLRRQKKVFALDADINIHFAQSLGVPISSEQALSSPRQKKEIRTYLRGTNGRVPSEAYFVKTTPPGSGSNLLRIEATDPFMMAYAASPARGLFVSSVGTYEAEEIGVSCYHTNLAIAENVISHTVDTDETWLITDMVAGTDAFSGSLHLLFDAIFLVVEPTVEGVAVCAQYKKLAEAAGVWERVWVIGNKIQDEEDEQYLQKSLGERFICSFREQPELRRAKRRGEVVPLEQFGQEQSFARLEQQGSLSKWDRQVQLQALYALHLRHSMEGYVRSGVGEVASQIDPEFVFPQE